jgi:hypothetical protein
MNHYEWKVLGVVEESPGDTAYQLERMLNKLEEAGFEVHDVMRTTHPEKARGFLAVGRKPRRFPRTEGPKLAKGSSKLGI